MGLVVLLLLLVLLTGGISFTGAVALGAFAIVVKVLFLLFVIGLLISLVRNISSGPRPYDPTL